MPAFECPDLAAANRIREKSMEGRVGLLLREAQHCREVQQAVTPYSAGREHTGGREGHEQDDR